MAQSGSLENGGAGEDGSPKAGKNPEAEPLNVRILHSLEETINQSVQAVKDAVIGAEVDDFEKPEQPESNAAERDEGSKSLLQSVEDTLVQSVHSVEEKFAHSVQTVKDAVNAAAEAAAAPAGSPRDEPKNRGDVTVEDEAAILVHSVIQD